MIAKRNTPEGDRLAALVTLLEAWEWKHYPMDLPDPVEAIKYHTDQKGLQPREVRSGSIRRCRYLIRFQPEGTRSRPAL